MSDLRLIAGAFALAAIGMPPTKRRPARAFTSTKKTKNKAKRAERKHMKANRRRNRA